METCFKLLHVTMNAAGAVVEGRSTAVSTSARHPRTANRSMAINVFGAVTLQTEMCACWSPDRFLLPSRSRRGARLSLAQQRTAAHSAASARVHPGTRDPCACAPDPSTRLLSSLPLPWRSSLWRDRRRWASARASCWTRAHGQSKPAWRMPTSRRLSSEQCWRAARRSYCHCGRLLPLARASLPSHARTRARSRPPCALAQARARVRRRRRA